MLVLGADRLAAQDRNFTAEQTSKETKTLAIGATGTLELKNLSGDIVINAGSGRDATVEITKKAKGRTDADAKDGLQKVTVQIDQRSDRATVETNYPRDDRRPPYSVSVDYTVTAPSGTHIVVESLSGDATIKGIRGDIQVNVTSGDITITGAGKSVNAKTVSGDVSVTGGDADATMELGSVSGDVTAQDVKAHRLTVNVTSGDIKAQGASADTVSFSSTSGTVEYSGSLSKNGRYELHSHAGEVIFVPSGNVGYEFSASTFNGSIQSNGASQNSSSTSTRGGRNVGRGPSSRDVHGTVGDGSAVVVLSTFSGNVVIGKSK